MKSKLDIIDDVIEAKEPVPENITIDAFIQFRAMDLYAKEVAIEFVRWLIDTSNSGDNDFLKSYTEAGLTFNGFKNEEKAFNQFIQSLNKEG